MEENISRISEKKRTIPFLLVTCFLCYFASESLLRQAAASNAKSKGFNFDKVIVKLPASIRGSVEDQIELARLRDYLKTAKKDNDIIITKISIASILGKDEIEKTHSEIIDEFPDSPYSASSYLHFFMAPASSRRSVSPKQLIGYINRIPESAKYQVWRSAYFKMKKKNIPTKQMLEFFEPIFEHPPEYQDYQSLFLDLSELAFQNGLTDYENKARKCESQVAAKPTLDSLEMNNNMEKEK